MADILRYNKGLKKYLAKAAIIDVKNNKEDIEIITEKMINALKQHPELKYVTANQVGYAWQMFTIVAEDKYFTFGNPLMMSDGKVVMAREQEYGLDVDYLVPRWSKVKVICYDFNNKKPGERDFEDDLAYLMQHILNNLDGISISEIGLPVYPEFDEASDSEKQEVIDQYLIELRKYQEVLENDIKNDSEASKMMDAIEFAKKRASGAVTVEKEPKKHNRKERRLLKKMLGLFKKEK